MESNNTGRFLEVDRFEKFQINLTQYNSLMIVGSLTLLTFEIWRAVFTLCICQAVRAISIFGLNLNIPWAPFVCIQYMLNSSTLSPKGIREQSMNLICLDFLAPWLTKTAVQPLQVVMASCCCRRGIMVRNIR